MKTIFISYAHEDEAYKKQLVNHLAPFVINKKITLWQDGCIKPGEDWDTTIKNHLKSADIVLLLISSDAITSAYIQNVEIKKSLALNKKGLNIVIPIILRPCKWTNLPIAKKQALPKDGIPVSKWENEDECWLNVVEGIEQLF